MRLLISYLGVMKILPNGSNYEEMIKFISQNFKNLPPKFQVKYKDIDEDLVSLCSQEDIDVMIQTVNSLYVKVYIQEESQEQQNTGLNSNQSKNIQETQREQLLQNANRIIRGNLEQENYSQKKENQKDRQISNTIINTTRNTYVPIQKSQERFQFSQLGIQNKCMEQQKNENISRNQQQMSDEQSSDQESQGSQIQLMQKQNKTKNVQIEQKNEEQEHFNEMIKHQKQIKIKLQNCSTILRSQFKPEYDQVPQNFYIKNREVHVDIIKFQQTQPTIVQCSQEQEQTIQDKKCQIQNQFGVRIGSLNSNQQILQFIQKITNTNLKQIIDQAVEHKVNLQIKSITQTIQKNLEQKYGLKQVGSQSHGKMVIQKKQFIFNDQGIVKQTHAQKKQQNTNNQDFMYSLTKKCFYLSGMLGRNAKDYKKYVGQNINLRQQQLLNNYLKLYPQSLDQQVGYLLNQRVKQLQFYFNGKEQNFAKLVKQNIHFQFIDLISLYKKTKSQNISN